MKTVRVVAAIIIGSSYVIISVISATLTIGMIISSVIYPYIAKKITGKMFVVISCVSCSVLYIGYVLVGTYIRNSVAVYVLIGVISLITSLGVTLVQSFVNIEFMKNVEPEYLA